MKIQKIECQKNKFRVPGSKFKLQTTNYKLQTTNYKLQTTNSIPKPRSIGGKNQKPKHKPRTPSPKL